MLSLRCRAASGALREASSFGTISIINSNNNSHAIASWAGLSNRLYSTRSRDKKKQSTQTEPSSVSLSPFVKHSAHLFQDEYHSMMDARQKVMLISGATLTGKSEVAVQFALNNSLGKQCEIISCDTVQMYKQLNIGANKTPMRLRHAVPHHFMDMRDLNDSSDMDVKTFVDRCHELIQV